MATCNIVDSNVSKIAKLFPSCVTQVIEDGKSKIVVDFDMLRQELSQSEIEGTTERYAFTWPNKRKAVLIANAPTTKTLRPARSESVNFDSTKNIYIEGDNLEVLKCLRETYLGKVKMIYIDPPYNTGNDFVYMDDYCVSTEDYLKQSEQVDTEGNRLQSNLETNGRFHTDWLNMIYPRIKIARDFLRDDGVLIISIDDHEIDNVKKICNEIFGESNFIATFPWRKRTAKSDVPFGISQDYEWIVLYAKTKSFEASIVGKERRYFETEDYPGRPWRIHDMTKQTTASERPNSFFTMIDPKSKKEYPANPDSVWRITKETFDDYYSQGRIVFPDDYEFLNISKPQLRYWKEEDEKKAGDKFGRVAVSTHLPKEVGMSKEGTKELVDIFQSKIFSFPKPSSLIKFFVSILNDKDAIILDFFSGSGTTAQAVMEMNAEDGGQRRFILVQIPEPVGDEKEANKAGYKNICEIGKERIRRCAIQALQKSQNSTLDIGYRVFKLDDSNMTPVYYRPNDVMQGDLLQHADNVKRDRTSEDLLFQVMLSLGATPDSRIERTVIAGKEIFNVSDGYLLACFEQNINNEVIEAIAKKHPVYFILRDSCFTNDSVADNFEQIFKTYAPETICKVI